MSHIDLNLNLNLIRTFITLYEARSVTRQPLSDAFALRSRTWVRWAFYR